jgi:hypothetical protein
MVVTIVRLVAAGFPPRAGVDRVVSTKVRSSFATKTGAGAGAVVATATVVDVAADVEVL